MLGDRFNIKENIEEILYWNKAKIVNVVDADTVDCQIFLPFHATLTLRLRLLRINAPERYTEEGRAATKYVEDLLLNKDVIIKTYKSDSFGRWLAEVYYEMYTDDCYWNCANDAIVEAGNAQYKDY